MTNSDSEELSSGDYRHGNDGDSDTDTLSANTDPLTSWGIVIGAFLVGGIGSVLVVPSSNFLSFLVVGCVLASPFWFLFTESGARWYMSEVANSGSEQSTQSVNLSTESAETKIICESCGWQNTQQNNFCQDCGTELDDSTEDADPDEGSTVNNSESHSTSSIGFNKDVAEAVAMIGSILIGFLLGTWYLFQGEIILTGVIFLTAISWPFLLTKHGRETTRRALGMPRSRRHNEPSSSKITCSNCGWHNHGGNNNCVECDARLEC